MTVNAITDTKKGRTGIAPTYLYTTPKILSRFPPLTHFTCVCVAYTIGLCIQYHGRPMQQHGCSDQINFGPLSEYKVNKLVILHVHVINVHAYNEKATETNIIIARQHTDARY